MSDDAKCSRCGNAYPIYQLVKTTKGSQFCTACWSRVDPKNEVSRKCPADGADMKKRLVADVVVIDFCSQCKGLWFDRDELEVVERRSREIGWSEGFFTSALLM